MEQREASPAVRNSILASLENQQREQRADEIHSSSAFVVKRKRYPERVHPDYRKWLPQTVYERDIVADQTVRELRRDPPGLSVIRDPSQYDRERERDREIRGVPQGSIPSEDFRVEVVKGGQRRQEPRESTQLQPWDLQTKREAASGLLRQEEELRLALQRQTLRNSAAYQNSICGTKSTSCVQRHKKRAFVASRKQKKPEQHTEVERDESFARPAESHDRGVRRYLLDAARGRGAQAEVAQSEEQEDQVSQEETPSQ